MPNHRGDLFGRMKLLIPGDASKWTLYNHSRIRWKLVKAQSAY